MISLAIPAPVEWLMTHADVHTYMIPLTGLWVLRALWLLWTNNNEEE